MEKQETHPETHRLNQGVRMLLGSNTGVAVTSPEVRSYTA